MSYLLNNGLALLFPLGLVVIVVAVVVTWRRVSRDSRHREDSLDDAPLPPLVVPPHRAVERPVRPPIFREPVAAAPVRREVTPVESPTIRMERAVLDQPLQFLPGRLEVERGAARREEIRFVRRGGETPAVTLGRADGPPYEHVKLPVETVSRMQARMEFDRGRWRITNLSRTNPTVVNGVVLDDGSSSRWLDDGDTIEMGEMVLRFHAR
jgi:hypothetical protein